MDATTINAILSKFPDIKGHLIAALHEIQNHYRYLPEEELRYLAKKKGIPITRIYSIATFYNRFSLQPKGRHQVSVCLGTACHVKGAEKILDELKRQLRVGVGENTDDMNFSLDEVRCVGACSLAPVVVVDDEPHSQVTPKAVGPLLDRYRV
jgi:NADH:ubiquinone oxidoreductase subunit E